MKINDSIKRRDFLKISGGLSAQLLLGSVIVSAFNAKRAEAQTAMPLTSLTSALNPAHATILVPTSEHYAKYNLSFNKRKQLAPQVRVMVSHPEAIQTSLVWAISNGIPFAIRCGGHSYEGFSQSKSMVIDVRGLNEINLSSDQKLISVGSGLALGQIYKALAPHGLAIPAGSCFPVGVSGHTLGGGFGLLGRKFGLAADSLESVQIVNAEAQLITANRQENPDLFWALRGGGNGSFGIVSQLNFRTSMVDQVAIFGRSWLLTVDQAITFIQNWQAWLTDLADDITCTFHIGKASSGMISLHLAGLSTGSETALNQELDRLQKQSFEAHSVSSKTVPFLSSAAHFNGPDTGYQSVMMKAKSDYVSQPMTGEGIRALLEGLIAAPGVIGVLADTYGGAINRIERDATAFVHRGTTLYSFQYFMQWSGNTRTAQNIEMLRTLYKKMRPFVSGEAYVNYCDLDLPNYAQSYWAENLPRLESLKLKYDAKNIFHHAQSVPLGAK